MNTTETQSGSSLQSVASVLFGELKLSGCENHPHRLDLSCCKIRQTDGTALTTKQVWEVINELAAANHANAPSSATRPTKGQRMVRRIATGTLCEPDRPGIWLWREQSGHDWQEVQVGCMGGGDLLFCWWPRMGDIDEPPWRGQWRLEKQAGPPYGRKPRRYPPNDPSSATGREKP